MSSTVHRLAFKRRRAGSTDYALRTKLLRSKLPQLVVRLSNKYVYAQVISPTASGDRVLTSASSRELATFGWMLSSASIPAAYLVGYIAGLRAIGLGIPSVILNMGLMTPTKGNRAFAVIGGAIEAGLNIPHQDDVMPSKDRLYGHHISEYVKKVKEGATAEARPILFSRISEEGVDIEAGVLKVKESIKRSITKGSA